MAKKLSRVATVANCGKNIMMAIKREQEAAILKDAVVDIPNNTWVAIRLSSEYKKAGVTDFDTQDKLITTLDIKDIKEEKVDIPKPRKEYKGFWKKLKLAFSKKVVYTEE